MSLKPIKFSETKRSQKELKSKMQKKAKPLLDFLPPYTYIVSEGTKTEPNYIIGMTDKINAKYYDLSSGKRIIVHGTGKSTKNLLQYARKQVEIDFPQATVVWLMYDKDDFPLDNFDNTQHSALTKKDKRKYKVAWSNECIELWFLLHFQDLTSNVGREKYRHLLRKYCGYEKNMPNIYDILHDKTNKALARAKQQYESYGDIAPSKMCPATRVYQLVEELIKYL
ncbi:MAG: RloB family protein [Kineothrix sp.]|nr:RloB family protein [Kineothrix sp.]NBI89094.1 RloB domain-containing protein [Lachnospiraceae bacterium]